MNNVFIFFSWYDSEVYIQCAQASQPPCARNLPSTFDFILLKMVYFLFAPNVLSLALCTVLRAMIFAAIQLGRGQKATEPQPFQARID